MESKAVVRRSAAHTVRSYNRSRPLRGCSWMVKPIGAWKQSRARLHSAASARGDKSDSISSSASAASAVTAATPTAQSVSDAKPTISAIFAAKIEKLIPTERIPRRPAVFNRGHTSPCGETRAPSSSPIVSEWAPLRSQLIRAGNF